MGLIELYAELKMDGVTGVWFFVASGPEDDDGGRMRIELMLNPDGSEIARRTCYPDQPERGWERTFWPHEPVFRSRPEGAVSMDTGEVFTRTLLLP